MAWHWQVIKWSGISTLGAALLVLLSVAGGLFYLAAHYAQSNPLDLAHHLPRIQAFLANRGLHIEADSLKLYYDEAPVVRIEGLRVLSKNGELAIFTEQTAVKFANGRLMQLAFSPKVVEAKGVTLRLVRSPDNIISIAGLRLNNATTATADDTRGVVEWLDDLPADSLWGKLKNVRVQGLTLLLRDEAQRADWVLDEGKLTLDRYAERGERGSLLAQVRRLGGKGVSPPTPKATPKTQGPQATRATPVLVTLERDATGAGNQQVNVEAKFGQLNAAVVGDYLPPELQDIITGQGTLALGSVLTRGNRLGLPWITLRLRNAKVNWPSSAGFSKPLALPQLEATLSYEPAPTDLLHIKNLSFNGPRGNLFAISGTILSPTTNPILALNGFSPGGDVQALIDFFPDADPKIAKTYSWLRNNLQGATYRNLVASSALRPKAFPRCGDACGGLVIDAEILGGKVSFLTGLPAAEVVKTKTPARFYWRGQTLAVVAPAAKLADQTARSVWVELNHIFSASPTHVVVSATLAGPLAGMVARLNGIEGIDGKIPGQYSGSHNTLLYIDVPLARGISSTFASTTLLVTSTLSGPNTTSNNNGFTATALPVMGNAVLAAPKAEVVLLADKTLRIVAPNTTLNGGGNLGLRWQQNLMPKAPSRMQLAVSGSLPAVWLQQRVGAAVISATGAVQVNVLAQEDFTKLKPTQPAPWAFTASAEGKGAALNIGPANYRKPAGQALAVQLRGSLQPSQTLTLQTLRVRGAGAEISGSLSLPLTDGGSNWAGGSLNLNPFTLGATQASIKLNAGTLTLRGAALDLRGLNLGTANTQKSKLNLAIDAQVAKALFGSGELAAATLQTRAKGGAWALNRLEGSVQNGGTASVRRSGNRVNINIDNVGQLLRVFGFYDKLKGGKLAGSLVYMNATDAKGELTLNDFELKNPPTMLKILGLLSLEQLVAGTDGTKFSTGLIPLWLDASYFTLRNARFEGPSMSLRLNGTYGRGSQQLSLTGSLAPAIPFNRLVTKIPLIGTLLSGSQDGVVVADFSLKGPPHAPEVTVQPLSVLTPGLLKDLFRGGNSPAPNTTPAKDRPR